MAWMSALFWRTSSLLSWIFSIMALKAMTDLPISSLRVTGTRCVKSWLVAMAVILASISPMGWMICRYSSRPIKARPSTDTRVTMASVALALVRFWLSVSMAWSLLRRFSSCTASISRPCSRRYWSTVAAMVASAASCWPASLNRAVSSMDAK